MAEVTPKQLRLIAALMTSRSIKAACRKACVSERTARSWFKDATFSATYREHRRLATEAVAGVLQGAAGRAARQLVKELTGTRAGDRIKAALGILEHANRAVELWDLSARVEALEAAKPK